MSSLSFFVPSFASLPFHIVPPARHSSSLPSYPLAFLAQVMGACVPTPSEVAMTRQGPISRFQFILTNMASPNAETPGGQTMQANMEKLRNLNCTTQEEPMQNVSALKIPEGLLTEGTVFLVGSPANHGPDGNPLAGQHGDFIRFKEQVFYSMCWHTPPHTAVAMTFSQGACTYNQEGTWKSLEWWTVLQDYPGRTFMLAPAWFRSYRPSKGLGENNTELLCDTEKADTMVAIFAPAAFLAKLQWRGDHLDMATTVLRWLEGHGNGKLVTFGAFTAELELDIAQAAQECPNV